jgi:hypothetical protein
MPGNDAPRAASTAPSLPVLMAGRACLPHVSGPGELTRAAGRATSGTAQGQVRPIPDAGYGPIGRRS